MPRVEEDPFTLLLPNHQEFWNFLRFLEVGSSESHEAPPFLPGAVATFGKSQERELSACANLQEVPEAAKVVPITTQNQAVVVATAQRCAPHQRVVCRNQSDRSVSKLESGALRSNPSKNTDCFPREHIGGPIAHPDYTWLQPEIKATCK